MQHFKPHPQTLKSFKKYLKKQGRVAFELKQLHQLIKLNPTLNSFISEPQQTHTVYHAFKVLIFLNKLVIENTVPNTQILDVLSKLTFKVQQQFQQQLADKLIIPYQLYLQRRSSIDFTQQKHLNSQQKKARVYQLLNLINTGTAFSDILYTIGRYYLQQLTCAIDFNIILGADLNVVYNMMIQSVKRPASMDLLHQIQAVHQKMYVVYYNCYFHKYLKGHVPKWVLTDVHFNTPQKSKKSFKNQKRLSQRDMQRSTASSKHMSNKSYVDCMGQSILMLNPKNTQQFDNVEEVMIEDKAGLALLMSMQRVVQMFKQ